MSRQRIKQQVEVGQVSVKRVVVCGPPASGKTTWVEAHRKPGDVVWDFDAVCSAMTATPRWNRPPDAIGLMADVLEAVVAWVSTNRATVTADAYLIVTARDNAEAIATRIGAELVVMEADESTCLARIDGDPARQQVASRHKRAVKDWFRSQRIVGTGD